MLKLREAVKQENPWPSWYPLVIRIVCLSHQTSWCQGKDGKMVKDRLEMKNGMETRKHEQKKQPKLI